LLVICFVPALMNNRNIILAISLPLSFLVILVSSAGLFIPGFYAAETLNWQAQAVGQDMINLFFIVPCLLITSIAAFRNKKYAVPIWGGIMLYLTYTFVIYCFTIHFNRLFIVYCLCLGLPFYALVYLWLLQYRENIFSGMEKKAGTRYVGIYLLLIAVLFYTLWLAEIIPANIKNTIPNSLQQTGLLTNGVQVLDLAIILPGIFITGILLLNKNAAGFMLTPILLTFFICMDVTIGFLAILMKMKGISSNAAVTVVMAALAIVSTVLLIWFLKPGKASIKR